MAAFGPPFSRSLLDRRQGSVVIVELVEVLDDAVASAAFVGPAGQPFVDDRAALAVPLREASDAQDVGPQLVHTIVLVAGAHMRHAVGQAIFGELGAYIPLADAGGRPVPPYPAAVEVTGIGADADATEVDVITNVDREPAPHLGAAPPARTPRLVALAPRLGAQH